MFDKIVYTAFVCIYRKEQWLLADIDINTGYWPCGIKPDQMITAAFADKISSHGSDIDLQTNQDSSYGITYSISNAKYL